MHRSTRLAIAVALVFIGSPQLHAQTCLGLPAASVASRNLTLVAAFPEGQSSFGGRLGGIGKSGVFAGLNASFDDVDASARDICIEVRRDLLFEIGRR